jgi:integrase
MFLWAQRGKLCAARTVPNWDFKVESESPKRVRMPPGTSTEFDDILIKWSVETDNIENPKIRYHRNVTIGVIKLVQMTGMRSGEIFGLRNRSVQKTGDGNVVIHVEAKTSKVRRERDITVAGYFLPNWMSETQIHKDANDFVFAHFESGRVCCRDVFYHMYKSLRLKLKEVGLEWFDLYHVRHQWVTNRLYAGEPIHLVAKAAGTSVREVESTYSHVLTAEITKEFNKRDVLHYADGSREVIDVPKSLNKRFEQWAKRQEKNEKLKQAKRK